MLFVDCVGDKCKFDNNNNNNSEFGCKFSGFSSAIGSYGLAFLLTWLLARTLNLL